MTPLSFPWRRCHLWLQSKRAREREREREGDERCSWENGREAVR